MRLAEALNEKKALVMRIADLRTRYISSAITDLGETPVENTADLKVSLDVAYQQLYTLTVKINQSNNLLVVDEVSGQTMMHAIAERDVLKQRIEAVRSTVESIRTRNQRHYGSSSEKQVLSEGVDLREWMKESDDLSAQLRKLDSKIQAANWTSELV